MPRAPVSTDRLVLLLGVVPRHSPRKKSLRNHQILAAGLADGGPNSGGFRANAGNAVIVGTDRDFMWGFMLGFFVGFVMLVWVWMPNVPHKQKLGILTGICFQLALNVLQQDRQDDDLTTATLDHADLVAGGLAMGGSGTNYGTVVQDGYG